ncbi:hypothetical protein BpHYR1_029634 [Brachionus plicatilis]|uniref:Uncharacterized protein n=1 Tax=Brachionus plicatilis TaxID=10195 RepID=A0A3M7RBV2_BRAPC|nr:hypothetical protein BpHYR1_029634 [Brachionus plicatilis]
MFDSVIDHHGMNYHYNQTPAKELLLDLVFRNSKLLLDLMFQYGKLFFFMGKIRAKGYLPLSLISIKKDQADPQPAQQKCRITLIGLSDVPIKFITIL